MAAGKKTGGRQKGAQNKVTAQRKAAIAASGETPLDYMLRVMRDPRVDCERRDRMAGQVAPYVHAKLSSVVHGGDPNKPLNVIHRVERVIVRADAQDGGGLRAAFGAEPI